MNDVFILRRGGGIKPYAVIGVTYPEGSVCTCTGKNSGKVLEAKKSPWVFLIPEADEWTVKASLDSKSREKAFTVSTEGQCEKAELVYNLVLLSPESGLAEGCSLDGNKIVPAVDVTDYTRLKITAQLTWASVAAAVSVGLSSADAPDSYAKSEEFGELATKEIDLSDMQGEYYFSMLYDDVALEGNAISFGNVNYTEEGYPNTGITGLVTQIVFE